MQLNQTVEHFPLVPSAFVFRDKRTRVANAASIPEESRFKRIAFGGRSIAVDIKMVGTARFELATSRTPSVRATRLRYVPTGELMPCHLLADC